MSDYIGGRWAVEEALRPEKTRVSRVFLSRRVKEGLGRRVEEMARARGVAVQWADERDLDRRLPGTHQGVVAEVAPKPLLGLREFLGTLPEGKGAGPVVLLDGIEDPQNLGAILRSAAFFGASGVVIPRRRSAHPSGVVAKVSAGGIEVVPVIQVANMAETISTLKEKRFWVAGADPAGSRGPEALSDPRLALAIGAEGKGLSRLVRERCDFLVRIPAGASGGPASLNASCAAAVLLYAASVHRKSHGA